MMIEMSISIKPKHDQILAVPEQVSDRLDSGLFIPASATSADERKALNVRVVSTGPGRTTEHGVLVPTGVEPGDVVVLAPYNSAVEVTIAGKRHLLVKANDVIAQVISDDAP